MAGKSIGKRVRSSRPCKKKCFFTPTQKRIHLKPNVYLIRIAKFMPESGPPPPPPYAYPPPGMPGQMQPPAPAPPAGGAASGPQTPGAALVNNNLNVPSVM